jgi:hypothetical protein
MTLYVRDSPPPPFRVTRVLLRPGSAIGFPPSSPISYLLCIFSMVSSNTDFSTISVYKGRGSQSRSIRVFLLYAFIRGREHSWRTCNVKVGHGLIQDLVLLLSRRWWGGWKWLGMEVCGLATADSEEDADCGGGGGQVLFSESNF